MLLAYYLDVFVFLDVLAVDSQATSDQVDFQLFNFDSQNNFNSLRLTGRSVTVFQFDVSKSKWAFASRPVRVSPNGHAFNFVAWWNYIVKRVNVVSVFGSQVDLAASVSFQVSPFAFHFLEGKGRREEEEEEEEAHLLIK